MSLAGSGPQKSRDASGDVADAMLGVRAVVGVISRSLGAALEQVTLPQLRLLVLLHSTGSMPVGELGGLLGLSPSATTRFAARMERDGWLRRARKRTDRRLVTLQLTPQGTTLVQKVLEQRERELSAALDRLPIDERRRVLDGLRIFAAATGEPADQTTLLGSGLAPHHD